MTALEHQADYLTAVQQACRKARESRNNVDLQKAAALLDSNRYDALPDDAKVDVAAAYGAAMIAVTGALS